MDELRAFAGQPLFGVSLTVAAYVAALWLNGRRRWLHPLFATTGAIIVLLLVCDIPYEQYRKGGDLITFFLGPTTVALAVPLYKAIQTMRRHLKAVAVGVTVGSAAGIAASGLVVWLLGGTREILLSMLPKSVTSPIAIEIAGQLGGTPQLAGVFTVLTGLLGSMFGPALLRLLRIRGDLAIGAAVGTAAHGIGTGRLVRESEAQAGISSMAMSLSGIITSVLCIPIYWWL
ncbi:LrgB family protein [Cohnella nanjingensis]|uniref:LrgB family protein n=1 Tax=Cohnella nanjingensis TaxID=1387779 RepID=A0A7X0VJ76_9BACL|nr:LrgB family protein [Cohnella nanjingensis]MBB6674424.1 LrgB family protein [Cohnella nanjingensis]